MIILLVERHVCFHWTLFPFAFLSFSFFPLFFRQGSLCCPGWPWTCNPPASASQVAGDTGTCHWPPALSIISNYTLLLGFSISLKLFYLVVIFQLYFTYFSGISCILFTTSSLKCLLRWLTWCYSPVCLNVYLDIRQTLLLFFWLSYSNFQITSTGHFFV
jgi:hypothetical protein